MSKKFEMQLGLNDCSNEEYHSCHNFSSSSDLKLLNESPAQFYERKILHKGKEESKGDHLDAGSLAHSLILEPHLVDKEYAFFPGLRRAGAEFEAFKAANVGKKILTKGKKAEVESWIRQYKANNIAADLIKGGHSEYTLAQVYQGMPLKCRADYINIDQAYIVDVKTSSFELDKESVSMTLDKWDYPLSAALYSALFAQYYGKQFDFYWLFLGKNPPDCKVYRMSAVTRMKGLQRVNKAIATWKQCMATNLWEPLDTTPKIQDTIEEV
jgi:exodeoxyribonuclease VIII